MKDKREPVCPVCGSAATSFKYRIERHNFSVHACASCGSQFQHPMPRSVKNLYAEGYYTGTAAFSYQDERRAERYHNFVHQARLRTIRKFITGPAATKLKFLDIGCAFGAFVRAAAQHGEAYGLDISSYAVKDGNRISHALASPAQLFAGDLSHLPAGNKAKKIFTSGTFSAITLIEVAEHLRAPRIDLAKAFSLLKPGGVLVIQTANFAGLQAVRSGAAYHYYLPGHLVYYTARGLKELLRNIGFTDFFEFTPTDFPLTAKWRKAWGDVKKMSDLKRFWNMSLYHWKSRLSFRGRPLTSSYVLYARK